MYNGADRSQVSWGLSSVTDVDTTATSSDFRSIVLRGLLAGPWPPSTPNAHRLRRGHHLTTTGREPDDCVGATFPARRTHRGYGR